MMMTPDFFVRLRFRTVAVSLLTGLFMSGPVVAQMAVPPDNPLIRLRPKSPNPPSPGVAELDRIVAVVNDGVITLNEVNARIANITREMKKNNVPLPPEKEFQKQVLERMINDLVQVQEARDTGIRVDDGTLDKTLQRIADENNVSMTDFRRLLEQDGISWAKFREEMRDNVTISRLREREVEGNANVTESEVDTQMLIEARDASAAQEFNLSHILVLVPEQATSTQIEARRNRAVQALNALRGGADFAQVAAQYSDAPDALQGGNLGWRESGRLPALFLEPVSKLEPGGLTEVLRSANGFHIVKLIEKRNRSATPQVQQSHARHILVRLKEGVTDADARERLNRLRERIIAGADFAELAKVHSDDPSASKGGDLGWLSPGDTVPEFERVMNQLRDGEISSPTQSPFGWHLIQVTERRMEGMSENRKRVLARDALRARKADEAYQDWLRQTRDRAFVEYRLDEK